VTGFTILGIRKSTHAHTYVYVGGKGTNLISWSSIILPSSAPTHIIDHHYHINSTSLVLTVFCWKYENIPMCIAQLNDAISTSTWKDWLWRTLRQTTCMHFLQTITLTTWAGIKNNELLQKPWKRICIHTYGLGIELN